MEALVDSFAWDLESDKVLTLDNGLPAFGAVDNGFLSIAHLPPLASYSL